jgi:hypothetical protein
MRDRGSMVVVSVLVGLAMTAAVLGAIVPLLGDLVDRQRAQAAADAAALAGVIDGRAAAACAGGRERRCPRVVVGIGRRGDGGGRGGRAAGAGPRHRRAVTAAYTRSGEQ